MREGFETIDRSRAFRVELPEEEFLDLAVGDATPPRGIKIVFGKYLVG
jgi:hypothetical protein